MLKLGTAKISQAETAQGYRYFLVNWMNAGSFLRNEPRGFRTEAEAREFCADRGLQVVA